LPTNDEWEIAARGIGRRLYPWGNKFDAARLPRPEVIKAYDFEDWHYVRRGRDPASDSPFGVSEMSGGLYEFALDGEAVALRGAPIGDERDAEPLDYSAVRFSVAPPRAVAAFRCVYDQKPH
jgi:formylglycine-generating enzyme required for sulfatase activity